MVSGVFVATVIDFKMADSDAGLQLLGCPYHFEVLTITVDMPECLILKKLPQDIRIL